MGADPTAGSRDCVNLKVLHTHTHSHTQHSHTHLGMPPRVTVSSCGFLKAQQPQDHECSPRMKEENIVRLGMP